MTLSVGNQDSTYDIVSSNSIPQTYDNGGETEIETSTEPETYDLVDHFSNEDVSQNHYDVEEELPESSANKVEGDKESLDEVFRDACFRQTCRQVITGRNLDYIRALNILQNEEYLTALTGEKAPIIDLER